MNADDRSNDTLNAPPGASDAAERTDAAGDATIVRVAGSAGTVNEKPGSFGRYELIDELARGGMGVVYRAKQRELQRTVALKMILGTGISHEAAQRFLQEARAAAALDHPNVVPIYDIGEVGDRPYFTMALVEGPNLRGHVEALGTVPIPTAVALFAQIVAGVAHAHRHGIIHRDLKPANVLIDKDGRPRVTDFGLAKQTAGASQLTVTGQVVGTPQYMAPEQARGTKDVGPPADVYALGAILYYLLTGKPPVQGESVTDVLIRVVTDDVPPPEQSRPDTPPELAALCMKCLSKRPEDRFADAGVLLDALSPITDRYLPPSGFASALSRASLGSTGSVGSLPVVASVPDLTPTANVLPSAAALPAAAAPDPVSSGATLPSVNVPAAPAPAAGRKLLVPVLVAAVVVLVGVGGFLATRDKKKDESAKGDTPAAKAGETLPLPRPPGGPPIPPPGGPPVLPPVLPVPPKVEPKVKAEDVAWPEMTSFDFKLDARLDAADAPTAGGVLQVKDKAALTLTLTAATNCRVSVWLLEPDGSFCRIFPNQYDSNDHLTRGQPRVLPGPAVKNPWYEIEASETRGSGADRFRVIATTGDPPALPPGVVNGPYTFYQSPEERAKVVVNMRGANLKQIGGPATQVSEAEVKFRATK
jgi:serine/threonine protein kinase